MLRRIIPLLAVLAASPALAQAPMQPVGGGSLATAQTSIGTAPVAVAPGRPGRVSVMVENLGSTAVYLGGPGVTAATGALLVGTAGAAVTISTTAPVYAVTASGTATVAVLEAY